MTKLKAIFLVFFAALIGVAIWFSTKGDGQSAGIASIVSQPTVIRGIITSEKENFFKDERVKAIFSKHGFDVQFERMASGKIAQANNVAELNNADFVFPSGVQTSDKLKSNLKGSQAYNVFYSPMVIATWNPIFDILKSNKVIKKVGDYEALDMESFMKLAENGVRWKDLKNSDSYPVNKVVLVSSSDSRFSNSAKMYLSLNSYVLNGHNVVSTNQEVDKVMPVLKHIIQAQGNRESSSTNMMSDYMSIGRGKVPMMFAYESEFLENAFRNGGLGKDMKLVYPTPTVFTKHVMVILNPKAQALVDLFKKDEDLKKFAIEYGFRLEGEAGIVQRAKAINIDIPEVVVDVIDPPNYDVLDYMADIIEAKHQ